MQLDWWTLALQTVNFAILVWLLHRFLYRPVLRLVDARRGEIERQYAEAASVEHEAAARRAALDSERTGMAAEREALLKRTAKEAEETANIRRAQAEREARSLIEETRKSLAVERDAARTEARRLALDLGAEIARRLLADIPPAQRSEAWLQRIEHKFAALAPSELAELRGGPGGDCRLSVATASPLPPEIAEVWRSRLRAALGESLDITFETDPALVGGAELRFPNAVLHASWQDTLAVLRAEIESR